MIYKQRWQADRLYFVEIQKSKTQNTSPTRNTVKNVKNYLITRIL